MIDITKMIWVNYIIIKKESRHKFFNEYKEDDIEGWKDGTPNIIKQMGLKYIKDNSNTEDLLNGEKICY